MQLLTAADELNLVYELPSILEPLDLSQMFSQGQPLEVELGSGDGSFLLDYAARHPERNFIGIERLLGRIRKLHRKGRRRGLTNLRGIRIESSYFLRYLLPKNSAAALHVYFPDPWPKRKHWRHRLINEDFPAIASQVLAPGGCVYFRTDSAPYFKEMCRVFNGAPGFERVETPGELAELRTDFEEEFLARGVETLRVAYRRATM